MRFETGWDELLIGMLAPFLLIVLKRAIDVVAPGEFLYLPVGSECLIRAKEIRHRTGIKFKAAVDWNRRAKLMYPIEAVAQTRQPR